MRCALREAMFKTLRYSLLCHNCGRIVGAIDGGGGRPH
jgi:hypothetical protein